jgi:1,4-alpha-glucan branching enzyme
MAKTSSKQPKAKTKKVEFELFAPKARNVSLAGDFNGWNVNETPMEKDNKGNWKVGIPLPLGRYEYRFWVDGIWHDDTHAQERVENPFGSHNCVRIVS